MTKLIFHLTRPAKKAGGDRYEATVEGEHNNFTIYVPQSISRPKGQPIQSLEITFKKVD